MSTPSFFSLGHRPLREADFTRLLAAGADPNERDHAGRPALHHALSTSLSAFTAVIEAGAFLDAADNEGLRAIHVAVRDNNPAALTALLDGGVSVDCPDFSLRTPLLWASQYGRHAIASRLIEAGANVNLSDGFTRTPLHMACRYAYMGCIELLLAAGADPDARRSDGTRPEDEPPNAAQPRVIEMLDTFRRRRRVSDHLASSAPYQTTSPIL